MDDREVVGAIVANDPTGIAVAYDTYAADARLTSAPA